MALLKLLHYPDERLRTIARPIAVVDDRIRQIVKDMTETMYAAPGIGLAATQVNIHERLILVDTSEDQSDLRVLINPEIVGQGEDLKVFQEGCLSVPDYKDKVQRFNRLRLKALDARGQPFELEAEGLLAQAIQHEIDHLDGKLYIDLLSSLKRERYKKKREKAGKRAA